MLKYHLLLNSRTIRRLGAVVLLLITIPHSPGAWAYSATRPRRMTLRPPPAIPAAVEPSVPSLPADWNPSTGEAVQDGTRGAWDFGVPIGGIGTGGFELLPDGRFGKFTLPDGRGNPIGEMPGSFFAVSAKAVSGGGQACVLRAPVPGGRSGIFSGHRLVTNTTYRGSYPFAEVDFNAGALPVRVKVRGFSPFIPGNLFDSSLPAAILDVELVNPNKFPVSVGVAFSWQDVNSAGVLRSHGAAGPTGDALFHSDLNSGRLAGILMGTNANGSPTSAEVGTTYYISTDTSGVFVTRHLHWDPRGLDIPWWRQFERACRLQPRSKTPPSWQVPMGRAGDSAAVLCATANLAPAEQRTIPFIVTWYKPVVRREYADFSLVEKLSYGDTFGSPVEVARYVLSNRQRLGQETAEWHSLISQSNLPAWFKVALCNAAGRIANDGIILSGERYEPFSVLASQRREPAFPLGDGPLASLFPSLYRRQLDVHALAFANAGERMLAGAAQSGSTTGDMGVFTVECLRQYRWGADLPFLSRCYQNMLLAMPRFVPKCSPESALCIWGSMSVFSQAVGDTDAATSFAARFKALRDCMAQKASASHALQPGCEIAATTISVASLLGHDYLMRSAGLPPFPLSAGTADSTAVSPDVALAACIGLVWSGFPDKGLGYIEDLLSKVPSWEAGRRSGNSSSAALAAWWLLPALGGLSFDLPAEILYFDPHLPSNLKSGLHIPVFTPGFVAWLDYNPENSAGALTVRKILDPAVAGRFIRHVARSVGDDGKPVGEQELPAPFELKEGAVLPLLMTR